MFTHQDLALICFELWGNPKTLEQLKEYNYWKLVRPADLRQAIKLIVNGKYKDSYETRGTGLNLERLFAQTYFREILYQLTIYLI